MTFNHHCLRNKESHRYDARFRLAGMDGIVRTQQRLHKGIKLHEILLCALLFIIVCGLSITSGTGVYLNSINQCLCYARINDDVFLHE